jgi:hypothetical protein
MRTITIAVAAALLTAGVAVAQQTKLFAYPQKGQSKEQQDKDEYECHKWAKENSGVDPNNPSGPDTSQRTGKTVRGAAKGAAAGAAVGAIAGGGKGAGKGAAIGAGAGGVVARRGAKRDEAAGQQQTQNTFLRAYAACMEGRGYNIK